MFGGPTPDTLAALIRILDSLRDADGATRIDGLDSDGTWEGVDYDEVMAAVAALRPSHTPAADRGGDPAADGQLLRRGRACRLPRFFAGCQGWAALTAAVAPPGRWQ